MAGESSAHVYIITMAAEGQDEQENQLLCLCSPCPTSASLIPTLFGNVSFSKGCVACLVSQSCLTLCDTVDCSPPGSSVHRDCPGKNTEVGCHAFLQGIFPTQGSNPGLLYCMWILYCLKLGKPTLKGGTLICLIHLVISMHHARYKK